MSDFVTAFDAVFGTYQPIVYELTDGTVQHFTDFSYVGRVALGCILFWGFFRLIGGIVHGFTKRSN